MNDTHANSVSIRTVLSSQAYVLFYARSDSRNIAITPVPVNDSLKEKSENLKRKWNEMRGAIG